jgi:hypothetical protein
MARPDLRIGDADRDAALDRLAEHYAAGRLDKDELDERSDAVWTARTLGDLNTVFADLDPAPRRSGGRRTHWRAPLLPVLVVLIALTVVTHVPFVLLALVGWLLLAPRWRRRCW